MTKKIEIKMTDENYTHLMYILRGIRESTGTMPPLSAGIVTSILRESEITIKEHEKEEN
jgi:hypothetical protein